MNQCYVVFGESAHCFSCGYHKGYKPGSFLYKPVKVTQGSVWLPEYTLDVTKYSNKVLHWLYSYYVYDNLIRKHHIAYCLPQSSKLESLLFPICNSENEVVEYQRRYFPKDFYSTKGVKQCVFNVIPKDLESTTLVLAEDFISTIRIGQITPSLCCFGTSIAPTLIKYIIRREYTTLMVWFDPDEPGIAAAKKIKEQLEKECHKYPYIIKPDIIIISSNKQPKEYPPTEITEIINNEINNSNKLTNIKHP